MPTALIIGASRGIGLELARQYRADGWRVIASARTNEACSALQALGVEAHIVDVCNLEHCAGLAWKLDGEKLDVAILNAGVLGTMQGSMSAPAQNEFDQVMQTNVLAAMRLLPILAPIVASTHGRLAVISSVMGSIAERTQNGMSLYRASKAALNSVLRDIALEPAAKGAICVAMHPGWVRTEMGGPNADISVDVSVAGIRQTLSKLTPEDNSSFYGYDGNKINW